MYKLPAWRAEHRIVDRTIPSPSIYELTVALATRRVASLEALFTSGSSFMVRRMRAV